MSKKTLKELTQQTGNEWDSDKDPNGYSVVDSLGSKRRKEESTKRKHTDLQRNDLTYVEGQPGLVLGWQGNKVIVQLMDGKTRLVVDESRTQRISEV